MNFPSGTSFFDFWFGPQYRRSKIDFEVPINLGVLVDRWAFFQIGDLDHIIANHTLWPGIVPFFSRSQIDKWDKKIRGRGESNTRLSKWEVLDNLSFRYCPKCFDEIKEKYGTVFWNRLHQFPGVIFCETHDEPLLDSNITKRGKPQLMTAESADLSLSRMTQLKLSPHDRKQLKQIASLIDWLLNYEGTRLTISDFIPRMKTVLSLHGLATKFGYIRGQEFLDAFHAHYSKSLLRILNCHVNSSSYNPWPIRVFSKNANGLHPLHYLLIINLLEISFDDFFTISPEYKPFGSGPWPCLNYICQNFEKLVIAKCDVDLKNRGNPIATFRCDCGFWYQRIANEPDPENQDAFSYSSIVERGEFWDNAFRTAWLNKDSTLLQISAEFNESPETLKRQAARLDLPTSPIGSYAQSLHKSEHYSTHQYITLDERKSAWLMALNDNPESSLTELCKSPYILKQYRYLKKKAPQWLDENSPSLPSKNKPWTSILANAAPGIYDVEIAEDICNTFQYLRHTNRKPETRISSQLLHRMSQHTKKYAIVNQRTERYAIMFATIDAVNEKWDEYYWHLFSWIICEQQIIPNNEDSLSTLSQRLGLSILVNEKRWREWFLMICDKAYPDFNYQDLFDSFYSSLQTDWHVYDTKLAQKVPNATQKIREVDGYPIKIAATSIGFQLDALSAIIKQPNRIPKTMAQINEHTETDEQYGLRIVQWAERFYISEKVFPDPNQFLREMNLKSYAGIPTVKRAINLVIDDLQKTKYAVSPVFRFKEIVRKVDFLQRDEMLAAEITEAIESIRSVVPPQRVSMSEICRWLDENKPLAWNKGTQITGKIHKYPKCKALLEQVIESNEDFRLREYAYRAMVYRKKFFDDWPEAEELFRRLVEAGIIVNVIEVDLTHVNYAEYDKFLNGTILLAYGFYIHLYPTKQLSKNKFKRKILNFHRLESVSDFVPETFKKLSVSESEENWSKRKIVHYTKQFRNGEGEDTTSVEYIFSYLSNRLSWSDVDDLLTDTLFIILPKFNKNLSNASVDFPYFPIHILSKPIFEDRLPKSIARKKELDLKIKNEGNL